MGVKFQLRKIIPRDVLYNTVPIVNDTVLFTQKLVKRVDFMLNILQF